MPPCMILSPKCVHVLFISSSLPECPPTQELGCTHMYRRLMYTCMHKTLEYMSRFANNFYQAFHLKLSLPDLLRHALVMHWYRLSSG